MHDSFFPQGQIRLSELSVYNWGSFHGLHSAKIDPQGTLITGDNGAGKSTLIDGLMALLLPAGKGNFNLAAAQGDSSDRNLLSYMRGSYGSEHEGRARAHSTNAMAPPPPLCAPCSAPTTALNSPSPRCSGPPRPRTPWRTSSVFTWSHAATTPWRNS